ILAHPCVRAALLRGGILWRLAISTIQSKRVLEGPTGCPGVSITHPFSSEQLVDDALTKVEQGLIVGAYVCYTGHGPKQVCIKSWWPLPETLEWAEDYGHCSGYSKRWFQDHLALINAGKAKPLSKAQWRDELRGQTETRLIRTNMEKQAHTFIETQSPKSFAHL
ncbi:hypothetical protein BKA70DRAFT_1053559, partial [Coprinopsis sp. MPI-PUGE-AT-0042]